MTFFINVYCELNTKINISIKFLITAQNTNSDFLLCNEFEIKF